jgi:hypothetical protein
MKQKMVNPKFIVNREKIEVKRKTLQQTSVNSDGWEIHYIDKTNNEKWIEYRMEPEYHGGGYPILVKEPVPNTEQLMEIALESNNLDEIAGASVFIYTNEEYDKIEFRNDLVEKIEKFYRQRIGKLTEFDIKKIKTIIYETSLSDSTNRKSTMGKHYTQIEEDHEYYKQNAERVKRILNEIKRSH